MANPEHLQLLQQGVEAWNQWRAANPESTPDLSRIPFPQANLSQADLWGAALAGADFRETTLTGVDFGSADLRGADFTGVELTGAYFNEADLRGATLTAATLVRADFTRANLTTANFSGANLAEADLSHANLTETNLSKAKLPKAILFAAHLVDTDLRGAALSEAILQEASLIRTKLEGADLTGCYVYGISAWNVKLDGTKQLNLVITPSDEPVITVDKLEVAQFIYLLLHNEKIREVIDTITSKAVLILGRFTLERKAVLDAMREELRHRNYLPIIFDFDKPGSKDVTGTVETLARMARFIIADLTDPSSIPHELATIVPFLRTTPVLPLRLVGSGGYSMFDDLQSYTWVLDTHEYQDSASLIASLAEVIAPADAMVEKLRK